ncbi:hypothetical protein [Clostridium sporogenes]|uniref:hypothetical protein n=1 Tax=Clostridium sporogenes TaxID=1509 RepID=UPI001FADB3CB|nr:hypothetical protein [Clostridium sporogenes]
MERSYNVLIDNGLYILGHYLKKDIEDITIEDIKNSTELFANKFGEYENCNYYKKNISMGFQNSAYFQGLKKDKETKKVCETRVEKVKNQFDLILNNIGNDEYCSICGKKHIKLDTDINYISSATRCLMPHIHANTFANYMNNLQIINICPICLYLSMISLYNCTKTSDTLTLYISDDGDFMEDYTYQKQLELNQNIIAQAKESKKQKKYYTSIEETIQNIIHNTKIYDGYIQAISFNNSTQVEKYIESFLSNKDINFIKTLEEKSLLSEFKEKGLFKALINNNLQSNYLNCVFDYNKGKLRISEELFHDIEEVYNKLEKDKLDLIKNICNKIHKTNIKNEIRQLKAIDSLNKFEGMLLKWNEQYLKENNNNLFTLEEFDILCDYKKYKQIKNRMLAQFMLLN